MKEIGSNIRKLRELRNYTQKYMAERLAMSQGNYARIENEEIHLSEDRLKKIAEILECTTAEILHFDSVHLFGSPRKAATADGEYGTIMHLAISPELKKLYEDRIEFLEFYIEELKKELAGFKINKENLPGIFLFLLLPASLLTLRTYVCMG